MTHVAYHALGSLAALLVATLLVCAPNGAQAQISAQLDPGRTQTDLGLGLGVSNALLHFEGRQYAALPRDMKFETELGAVPQVGLQLRHWLDRSFGLRIGGSMGRLGALKVPTTLATTSDGAEASLQVLTHELELSVLYRYHFSESPTSLSIQAEFGFELLGYGIQEQDPAILVSTSYVGPNAALGLHVPITKDFCVTATGGAFLPFYVYEDPVGSGKLDSSMAIAFGVAAEYALTESISAELTVRRFDVHATYAEHGSRGVSGNGVFDAEAQDTFNLAGVNVHFKL